MDSLKIRVNDTIFESFEPLTPETCHGCDLRYENKNICENLKRITSCGFKGKKFKGSEIIWKKVEVKKEI